MKFFFFLCIVIIVSFAGFSYQQVWASERVLIPYFGAVQGQNLPPALPAARVIRFLTDDDFPPLSFADEQGRLTGFSTELARALCDQLQWTCSVQTRPFETLKEALASYQGDVVAAAFPLNAALKARFLITRPYYRLPARFISKKVLLPPEQTFTPQHYTMGVIAGTVHEAYAAAFFASASRRAFPDVQKAQQALKEGAIDLLFADAQSLALWLGGSGSEECCMFRGGPYLDNRYFGEGTGFITRKEDIFLQKWLDYGLQKLWDNGTYAEIYLRFFPVGLY
jgi:polar amino acid transport system substrate-binding protein